MAGAVAFLRHQNDSILPRFLELSQARGTCALVGMDGAVPAYIAGLINGTLSEVLDFSDCVLLVRNHPGAPVVPAALAVANLRPTDGRGLLTAMAVAYEVFTRICQAIQPDHWYRGFQCTGTIGCCGAATAAAKLYGADAETMYGAIGVAGSMMPVSNGDNIFRGHSVKPLHAGAAAANGITAAMLALAGMRAGPLEGQPPRFHGPLPIVSDKVDTALALDGLGTNWRIEELAYKPFPIGLLNIGPVEICRKMAKRRRLRLDDVATIRVRTYKDAAHFVTKYTSTESDYIDCYLSLPYCVAVTLMDGDLWLEQLERERISDPEVHEIARKVVVEEDPAMTARYPNEWPVEIVVVLNDGSVLKDRVDAVMWSPRRPPTWDKLVEKFHRLVSDFLGTARTARIVEQVARIETLADTGELFSLIAGGPSPT
jgi:2-methylcitrate dehydratase PrpD